MPQLVCELDIPTRPADLAVRDHNRYAKEALREAVERWWQHDEGFPSRFKREAKTRFHHFERQERYKKQKARKFHSTVDLVKTGASKQEMLTQAKIQIGGSAAGGNISVTFTTRFAFRGGTGKMRNESRQGVTIQQMQIELQDCDQRDAEMISKWMLEGYMKRLNGHRSSRKRLRLPKR